MLKPVLVVSIILSARMVCVCLKSLQSISPENVLAIKGAFGLPVATFILARDKLLTLALMVVFSIRALAKSNEMVASPMPLCMSNV